MNAIAEHAHIERPAIEGGVIIPLGLLRPNPYNRKRYDAAKFRDLVESVKKVGVIQPIIARAIQGAATGQPLYEIVAGERRWRASKEAGLATIPVLLRELTDLELLELLLTENAEREDMNALDEAECLDKMLARDGRLQGYASVDELAARIGRSRAYVFQRLKLLTVCEEARQALLDGTLDASHVLIVARIHAEADQRTATREIIEGWGGNRMSVRDAQEHVQRKYMLALDRAAFKITDETLVPAAGSCSTCPKRAGANPDLFDDVQKGDTCTDPACFDSKTQAHRDRTKAQAAERGIPVLTGKDAKKAAPQQYGGLKGFLELDKVHHQLGDKPLRKLLGKDCPQVHLLENPHTHDLVEVVADTEALAVLKAAGKIKTASMPSSSAAEREANARRKRQVEWRQAVALACVENAGTAAGLADDFRAPLIQRVALRLWHSLGHDTRVRMLKLLGWPPIKSEWSQGPGITADQHFAGLDAAGLTRFFTAATVAHELCVPDHSGMNAPEVLLATAEALGVDHVAILKAQQQATRVVPEKKAAERARKRAAQATPETALAAALKKASSKAPPVKYRNPATGDTWTGRGLKPKWLATALQNGATLASFETSKQEAA